MKQLFEVDECVLLKSNSRPELNGEYTVKDVLLYGQQYTCRISGREINHIPMDGTAFSYRLEEVQIEAFSDCGVMIENSWKQTALRKKQEPSDMGYKELMTSLKNSVLEWN